MSDSLIGNVFRTLGKHIPAAPGLKSPALWGSEPYLRDLWGDDIAGITTTKRFFVFSYCSAEHMLAVFRTFYGPMLKAFAALDDAGQAELAHDLTKLFQHFNLSGDDTLAAPGEYLEVVATRR